MKFTDIAAVAKRSKTAIIMNDNEGGAMVEQWCCCIQTCRYAAIK